jgi:hypothetical protein
LKCIDVNLFMPIKGHVTTRYNQKEPDDSTLASHYKYIYIYIYICFFNKGTVSQIRFYVNGTLLHNATGNGGLLRWAGMYMISMYVYVCVYIYEYIHMPAPRPPRPSKKKFFPGNMYT